MSLFYELWMNGAMATLIDDQIALLTRMRDVALGRVQVGKDMAHHDVLRAEAAIDKTQDVIDSAQTAYTAGTGDLLPYLDAIMELQELESRRIAAVSAEGVAHFEVSRVVGAAVTP